MSGGRIHEGFVPGRFLIDAYGNGVPLRGYVPSRLCSRVAVRHTCVAGHVASQHFGRGAGTVFEERDASNCCSWAPVKDVAFVSPSCGRSCSRRASASK